MAQALLRNFKEFAVFSCEFAVFFRVSFRAFSFV